MYQLLINNPFFFWIWGSLIVAYLVVPVYMVFVVFSYVEYFFGMLTILWKGGRTVVGGVVGFIDQTNQIAESLSSGGIVNVTNAVVNKYLPGKDNDSKAISGFLTTLGGSLQKAIGVGYNQSSLIATISDQVDRTKDAVRYLGPE